MNNIHFFQKRLVFLKSDAEKTFGDLDDLKKPSTVAPEFSVNAKIAEADAVWGLSEDELRTKYDDKFGAGVLPLILDQSTLVKAKIKLIDALDGDIKVLAGADLRDKVKELDKGMPNVQDILSKAQQFYSAADGGVFGSEAEKQLYIKNLEKFGLNLKDADIQKKINLANDLPSKIREQEQKEADLQLAKLELEQLKQNAKDTDERYENYNRIFFKVAKLVGIGAVGGATLASGGMAMGVLGGLSAVVGFVPQIDISVMKAGNKIKQWWKESVWGIPGAEKAKKQADFKVQNIQNRLNTLQAKENLKKGRIEADLNRLKERRAAIVLQMKPFTERIHDPASPHGLADTKELEKYQKQLSTLDNAVKHHEKLLKVFVLAEKHRDKLGNSELLDAIAKSEHLPGTGGRIKEIYEAPDKRTVEAQKEISKIKMGDISYIIEGELNKTQYKAVKQIIDHQLLDQPNPSANFTGIDSLKKQESTKPLYDLLVNMAKMSKENPFRKEALRVLKEAKIERKLIVKSKGVLKAYVDPIGLSGMKDLFEAISSNKKNAIRTKFAPFKTWGDATASTEAKLVYSLFKKTVDSASESPFRKAALKMMEGVLKSKGLI